MATAASARLATPTTHAALGHKRAPAPRVEAHQRDEARALPDLAHGVKAELAHPAIRERAGCKTTLGTGCVLARLDRSGQITPVDPTSLDDGDSAAAAVPRFEIHSLHKVRDGLPHRVPLGQLRDQVKTRVEDLITVCANCHRMLHRMAGTRDDASKLKRTVRRG
jgi:hypothetical protein